MATFARTLAMVAADAFAVGATDYEIATAVMRYALDSGRWGELSESDIRDLSWAIAYTFTSEED